MKETDSVCSDSTLCADSMCLSAKIVSVNVHVIY